MQYKDFVFPEGFLWGGATSGPQSEGREDKLHRNVFDYWYDTQPNAFWDRIGPGVTSDFYHRYQTDFALLRSIGFNSFRTSIQWTRLIRDFETGEPDERAVRYYEDLIDAARENGIELILNLHHFDLPVALYDQYGGWESRHVVDLFARYAETAFRLFGAKVKRWTTFNEPMVIVEGQYLYQFHYPSQTDGRQAMQVLYNLNLASAKAIAAYRKHNFSDGSIGIILNLTPTYPRNHSPKDQQAADIADAIFNKSFLDPAVLGHFPAALTTLLDKEGVLWRAQPEDQAILRAHTIDFLGVNYYRPKRVKAKEKNAPLHEKWMPDCHFDDYVMPGCTMNPHRGWEIYPAALYDIALRIQSDYHNIPWYVAENGMGVENEERFMGKDGVIDDAYRIEFYQAHLQELHRGIQAGSNCFGFHAWTPIDCWSWLNAYKNRYGFIAVDLATQQRTIKQSGRWFARVSTLNALP